MRLGKKVNKFIVIVPVYNSEKYIDKCLKSILNQTYTNYNLIVVDDGSTDNTAEIINNQQKLNYINTGTNYGSPLRSFKTAVDLYSTNPEDILVTVDGDDYLYNNKVLEYLNNIYQDNNIWMTYGQYVPLSNSYSNFCKPINDFRKYRREGKWCSSHLRTVKNKIFKRIKEKDFLDGDGNFKKYANDMLYMFSCLEMCGSKHTKFIDKVLYVYNDLNEFNQMKICGGKDLDEALKIRSMQLYLELK
jgi:glycosyltransferase involved in cell wall biosynthesis